VATASPTSAILPRATSRWTVRCGLGGTLGEVQSTLGRREFCADQVLVDLGEQDLVGICVFENEGFDG